MLEYEQTKIRPLAMSDIDNIMSWVNDPEVVGRYAYFTEPYTREQELSWLEQKINSTTDFFYAIENEHGEYLGNVAVEKIHWPAKNGRLSITIGNKNARGQGHGTRATNLILDKAFNTHGLHKVYLVVAADNPRSIHINENKIGFKREGLLKDHYIIDGKYVDMIQMYMLEDEFRAKFA